MDASLLATILRELRSAGWIIEPPKETERKSGGCSSAPSTAPGPPIATNDRET